MERVRRRFWTWAVTLLASAVILAAVVSGLFQLAVLALPSYRAELAAWVTRVADRPVEIGGIHLAWRGIYPRIDLTEITVYDEEGHPALTADRVGLGFSGLRLVMGQYMPTRIELSGLNLVADVDEEGNLRVAGFDALGDEPFPRKDELLRQLSRFQFVRLQNCQVRLTHAQLGRTPLPFTLLQAEIDRTRRGFDLDAELQLPHIYGDRLELNASIVGEVPRPRSWNGDFEIVARDAALQPWLERWLRPQTIVQAKGFALDAEGVLKDGRLHHLQADLAAQAVIAARDGRAHSLRDLEMVLAVREDEQGWRVDFKRVEHEGQRLLAGALRLLRQGEQGFELDLDLDSLQLGPLAPWLAHLRPESAALARAAHLKGELRGMVLRLRKRPERWQYTLHSELLDVSMQPPGMAGISGLSGALNASEDGGRLQLAASPVQLQLPEHFAVPLPFDRLGGELSWRRLPAGWQLHAPSFDWALAGTEGKGQLKLELPDNGASPHLDVSARFRAGDVNVLKPFMPRHWSPQLRRWLEQGIRGGRVPQGDLRLRGVLADFPFRQPGSGAWQLRLQTADAALAFAPDWPLIDQVHGEVRFAGPGLDVVTHAARFGGNPVQAASARFEDLREGMLRVDGRIVGEVARFYELLRRTPLQKPLAGLLERTRAAGPASVQVRLGIPVHDVKRTEVAGEVALEGVQLFYDSLDPPVNDIRGRLTFGSASVASEGLTASFGGVRLDARIEARPQTAGVIVADFNYSPTVAGGVNDFVPELVRKRLSGESRWRAELPLDAPDAALTLSSDLRGMAVQFPAPLGKSAAEAAPIRVLLGADSAAPARVRIDYAQRLGVDVALGHEGQPQRLRPQAVRLQLGGGFPSPAQGRGVVVTGSVPELDLGQWLAAFSGGTGSQNLPLREADIRAERWLLDEFILGAAHLRWAPVPEGWRAQIEGPAAEGELRYAEAGGGELRVALQRLQLQRKPAVPAAPPAGLSSQPAKDPKAWPTLDLRCEHLVADGIALGRVTARSTRIAHGQRLETLAVEGGPLGLVASGNWTRVQNRSSAELTFDARAGDVAAVLRALGYTPNLSGRNGRFSGSLSWPAAPRLDWQLASGKVDVAVGNGALRAVEPGAGRVLGLFNFYAIPRRLLLDFRDVVNEGLSFDELEGSFTLGRGVAHTRDLTIRSPSLRMEIRGRIGLAARDFDQTVHVYPGVSSGVTLGAALLGGPAVGALVLLAQEVLDKPLEQATQLSYRVTGSWDNPKIERGGSD